MGVPEAIADPAHLLGVALALGGAVASACTNLFVRKGTDGGRAIDAVFVVITVSMVLVTLPIALVYFPEYGLTRLSWLSFIGAGITGTLLGQLFHFASIDRIGASRTAPIVASWALVSTVFGVLLLGESVSPAHLLGVVLVVGGVAAIAWETSQENPDDLSRRELLIGLVIPFAAALAYGVEPVFATIGLSEGTAAPVGLAIKTVAAFLGFTLYLWWHTGLPDRAFVRQEDLRWFVLAGVTTSLFLLGYYVALELAPVSIVAPIIITNTLFVVLLSASFMPERLERVTGKLAVLATVVVIGVSIIVVSG